MRVSVALVAAFLLGVALCADDFTGSFKGRIGNGNILIGQQQNGKPFTTPGGLQGEVTVSTSTVSTSTVKVCFSAQNPAVGADIKDSCVGSQYGSTKNSTKSKMEAKFTRKSFSAFASKKRMFEEATTADDDASFTVELLPNTPYYVTVTTSDKNARDVEVSFTGSVCNANKFGPNCIAEPEDIFKDSANVTKKIKAGEYLVFKPTIAASTGGIKWEATQTDDDSDESDTVELYAGAYFIPTKDNFVDAFLSTDDETQELTLHNPAAVSTWYIAIYNSGEEDHTYDLFQGIDTCNYPKFDNNCRRDVKEDITQLSVANATSVYKFKAPNDDDDEDLAYFQIIDTHTDAVPKGATYFRVSVTRDEGDAPELIATAGYPPSKSYYNYRASDQFVNQLVLPILAKTDDDKPVTFEPSAWYVGVSGKDKYTIWVGNNCAEKCTKNGKCICDGQKCNPTTQWRLPVEGREDSWGRCQCKDDYNNYDCTGKADTSSSGGLKTIYIILIAVGGAIVLAVAIGVPVYCYLQNRKRNNYERV